MHSHDGMPRRYQFVGHRRLLLPLIMTLQYIGHSLKPAIQRIVAQFTRAPLPQNRASVPLTVARTSGRHSRPAISGSGATCSSSVPRTCFNSIDNGTNLWPAFSSLSLWTIPAILHIRFPFLLWLAGSRLRIAHIPLNPISPWTPAGWP